MLQRLGGRGLLLALLLPLAVAGQDERPPVTTTYFINNAFIVQQPGRTIDLGGLLIRDGLIAAVGKGLTAPVDAKVIEGDSMYVYAGFIDGLSRVGMPKPKEESGRPRVKDPGNPPRDISGIQPERFAADLLDADDKSIGSLKAIGFTTAHVVPYGKMLPGKGAIVQLAGATAGDMVLRRDASLFAQFQGSGGRVYPSTTMAIMAKWRDLYAQAQQRQAHAKDYAATPGGMTRPQHDVVLESLFPVLDGRQPVFFAVDNIKEVHRALGLAEELGFPLALANLGRAQLYLDRIKGGAAPLFLKLDLPEAPKKDKKKDAEEDAEQSEDEKPVNAPQESGQDRPDNLENTVKVADETEDQLETRRAAAMKTFEEQAAILAKAGVPFGFASYDGKAKDIRANLRRMIAAGLGEDQALAALTVTPAKLLGLSAMMGTVEKGKIANLVVTDAPYFAEKSNVRYVFVDGVPETYEVKKAAKKKAGGDPSADVRPLGSWSLAIDAPVETPATILTLSGSKDDLSGVLKTGDSEDDVEGLTLSGNNLAFSVDVTWGGQEFTLSYDLTIDGDNIEGKVIAGEYGAFDVSGSRQDP